MSNYTNYLSELSSGGINIAGQTGYNKVSYTSPDGLNFLCGITGYSGTNSATNSYWVFNCTNTPSTFPVWGFSNKPYFYGYITTSNPGSVNNPAWFWNNLPLGTYKIIAHSNGSYGGQALRPTIAIYSYTYSSGTLTGYITSSPPTAIQNYHATCTINPSTAPYGTTPTMNILLQGIQNSYTNPDLTVYLFKLI